MNLGNFFIREGFEETIRKKMMEIDDVNELVHRNNFVEQVKR